MASKNETTARIILVITGILVLTALAYFATRYFTTKEKLEESDVQIKELITEIEEREQEIVSLQTQIDDLSTDVGEKDQLINEQLQQIEKLENRLKSFKGSPSMAEKVKGLESRISLMRTQMQDYQETISDLKETIALQSDSIATAREITEQQEGEITNLNETLEEREQRLKIAAKLQAADFTFFRVRNSGKEIRDFEFRRLGLDEIKVCFNVLKNSEATPGKRTLYMVIENPDGSVSSNEAEGYSGSFQVNGAQRAYSAKTEINFSLTTQEVCIPYKRPDGEKYEKGDHFVNVYANDELIGQQKFTVK